MTPKQIERLKTKIADIKRILAAEKRKFGGYDDSPGLRYVPIKYYIKIADFSGGLAYTKWFSKNFPDDGGFPDFLFEWTIILYKNGKTKEAEKKAIETFCSNSYLFDKFLDREIVKIDKWEGSNLENTSFLEYFDYKSDQLELVDFANWLTTFIATEKFLSFSEKFIDLNKRLKSENEIEKRHFLIMQLRMLKKEPF